MKNKKTTPWWDTPLFAPLAALCALGFYALAYFMLGLDTFIR